MYVSCVNYVGFPLKSCHTCYMESTHRLIVTCDQPGIHWWQTHRQTVEGSIWSTRSRLVSPQLSNTLVVQEHLWVTKRHSWIQIIRKSLKFHTQSILTQNRWAVKERSSANFIFCAHTECISSSLNDISHFIIKLKRKQGTTTVTEHTDTATAGRSIKKQRSTAVWRQTKRSVEKVNPPFPYEQLCIFLFKGDRCYKYDVISN